MLWYIVLIIALVIALLVIFLLFSRSSHLREERDQWEVAFKTLSGHRQLMQPIIEYLLFCHQGRQYVSEEACRAFLAGRNIDYDILIEAVKEWQQQYPMDQEQ
jgi:hypothetical protein